MDGHSGGRGSQTQVFQAPSSTAPSKTNAGDREGSSRIYNGRDFQPTLHNDTPPAENTRKGKRQKSTAAYMDHCMEHVSLRYILHASAAERLAFLSAREQDTFDSNNEEHSNSRDKNAGQGNYDSQDESKSHENGGGEDREDEDMNNNHSRIRQRQKKSRREKLFKQTLSQGVFHRQRKEEGVDRERTALSN